MKKFKLLFIGLFALLLVGCKKDPKKEDARCTFTFNGVGCTLEHDDIYDHGVSLDLQLVVLEDYDLPETIEVTGTNTYSYDSSTGSISLVVDNNIVINASAKAIEYVYYLSNVNSSNPKDNSSDIISFEKDLENKKEVLSYTYSIEYTYTLKVTRYFSDDLLLEKEEVEEFENGELYSSKVCKFEYDSNKNLIKESSFKVVNKVESLIERFIYAYNDDGSIKTKTRFNEQDNMTNIIKYSYNIEGIKVKEERFYASGDELILSINFSTIEEIDNVAKTRTLTKYQNYGEVNQDFVNEYVYDASKDNELLIKYAEDENSYTAYSYNQNNDICLEEFYHTDNNLLPYILDKSVEYEYNNGILMNVYEYDLELTKELERSYKYTYNENGFISGLEFIKANGEIENFATLEYVRVRKDEFVPFGIVVYPQGIGSYTNPNDMFRPFERVFDF